MGLFSVEGPDVDDLKQARRLDLVAAVGQFAGTGSRCSGRKTLADLLVVGLDLLEGVLLFDARSLAVDSDGDAGQQRRILDGAAAGRAERTEELAGPVTRVLCSATTR